MRHAIRVRELILALNAGSSSLKFGLFDFMARGDETPAARAIGTLRFDRRGTFRVRIAAGQGAPLADEEWPAADRASIVERLLQWIKGHSAESQLAAVGHRIVHGGVEFGDPVAIDDAVLGRLEGLVPLAPLHQPAGLDPVRAMRTLRPDLPQVACFDTAFHRTIRPPASRYALPRAIEAEGIRRYGFHGLSYESIAAQIANSEGDEARRSRIVVAHLGNGASLCALKDLESVDTTMGFSTLDGLVMGTRPGSLDPGILLYLLKGKNFTAGRLERLLYEESGLLGVSGISSDVATLLSSEAAEAREALELFAFQVARQTAALAATLGGLERFIFTGGIGEHAPEVRAMIVERLKWLGAELDEEANRSGATRISSGRSSILIEWRDTQEELMIARHVADRMRG